MKRTLLTAISIAFSICVAFASADGGKTISREVLMDKIKGGWAGQTIGCTYGGSTEFYYRGRTIPDSIAIEWPEHYIKYYFDKNPGLYDDVYMDLTFVDVFDRLGLDAPVEEFAKAFTYAGYQLWHANLQGRVNMMAGINPPESGHWKNNPHADDIDFQIEADYAGLMCPGLVDAAAYYCDGIGHIMNYGDGWYGGVWVAAMYSLAFINDDIEAIVAKSLEVLPEESRYYHCIASVLDWYKLYPNDWRKCWQRVQDELAVESEADCPQEVGNAFRIDADINGAYIAIGLLYGHGDFEKTMEIATRCGQDSDCNPASACGILATMKGYSSIPEKYLRDVQEIENIPFQYTDISLSKAYQMSFNQALEVIRRNGGKVSRKSVTIPSREITPVRYEKSFEGICFQRAITIDRSAWLHGNDLDLEFDGCGIVLEGRLGGKSDGDYVAVVEVEIDGIAQPDVLISEKLNSSPDHIYHNYSLTQGHHRIHLRVRNPREDKKLRYVRALIYEDESIQTQRNVDVVDYVNTLVGTMSTRALSTGNTYPSVSMPWGTHSWTPQTGKMGNGWAYVYTDSKLRGVKMTHQPSPWINDYGFFSFMPVTNGDFYREDDRASWFSHKAEKATPYYYSVYMADHDATVELTPTDHAAALRLTYPRCDRSHLVIDNFGKGSVISVDKDGRRITGYTTSHDERHGKSVPDNFKMWFVIECDTPVKEAKVIEEDDHAYAILTYSTSRGQQIALNVAASFISAEQAEFNLNELGDGDFDRLCQEGRDRWNEVLGRIEVEDGDIDHLRTFYSCLYRSVLFPRSFSELTPDGRRVHYSPYDGKVHDGHMFTDTGFWDTFRSLFALVDLVYPEVAAQIQEGLVNTFLESGFLPEWASPGHVQCMVGNNSASVVAEAYLKGLRGYDIETLWQALKHGAHSTHPSCLSTGRLGYEYYDSLGYVPCDAGIRESAARTLEYAYDDWCIYELGKALGKPEEEIAPYRNASQNYRNLYRPEYHLMSGRNADGSFPQDFNPLKWGGDFTEGNAIHYTWSVFHDPDGLAELMGGKEQLGVMLDSMFVMPPVFDDSYYGKTIHEIREMQIMNMGNYAHGNQPVQHSIYLYNWAGTPWKTQQRVREVMEKFYTCTPDGYCGDEDNGQTSAWYIFSALGFYPVCPASCEYSVGSPLFDSATIHLPNGNDIRIKAPGNGRKNVYVREIAVDDKPLDGHILTHSELLEGPQIRFTMSSSHED